MCSAGAHGDLTLARSAACAKVFENFRAEGFHRMPASNLSGTALLYRRLRGFQRVAWPARSIPATPPRNRLQSLQTVAKQKSGAFLRRAARRPAVARRPQECEYAWPPRLKPRDPRAQRSKKLWVQRPDQRLASTLRLPLPPALEQARGGKKQAASRRDARHNAASHKRRLE